MTESFSSRSGVEVLADRHIEKPLLDNRSYRVIKLPNDLEALLIHDPDTDKASAAVDVNVGSFSDADDMPGMAHAVEHLLFMGTKKVRGITGTGSMAGVEELTPAHIVSRRERLQHLPDQVRGLLERLHRVDVHELLLRVVRLSLVQQPRLIGEQ